MSTTATPVATGKDKGKTARKKLGEIFVERELLTPIGVDRIVALSQKTGKRFGRVLEDLGLVTGHELAEALAVQYSHRVVKEFHRHSFAPELLKIIPVNVAVENNLFPLKIGSGKLAIAISDPTDTRVMNNIGANNGVAVVPFIATRQDIHDAITVHYLKRELQTSKKHRILIVEDDKVVKTALAATLTKEGYDVFTAEDGMEAFREVIAVKPDLIITDKEMPKFNGYAFFDSIKKLPETARTPVILISITTTAEEEAAAFEKGFFDFIPKPIKDATLRVKVRRAIAGTSIV